MGIGNKVKLASSLAKKYHKLIIEELHLFNLEAWYSSQRKKQDELCLAVQASGIEELKNCLEQANIKDRYELEEVNDFDVMCEVGDIRGQYFSCKTPPYPWQYQYALKVHHKKVRKELRDVRVKKDEVHEEFYGLLNEIRDED